MVSRAAGQRTCRDPSGPEPPQTQPPEPQHPTLPAGSRSSTRSPPYCAPQICNRLVVFAAAAYQGAEFASTKPSATAWGGVIGFAAFLAWLAVDEEEACEGGGAQEDEDAALDLDDDDDEPVAESHAKSD